METYTKINPDLIRKTITEDIDLKPLKIELKEIEDEIKVLEKEPDELMQPNYNKFGKLGELQQRQAQIKKLVEAK